MPRYLESLIIMFAASAITHGATVISRDNTRHEGTIVENNSDGVKLKVKMGTLEAFVNVARADILEIQNTPERVNPVEASAKELLDDAEFAMQAKKPKDAAAAWAKLGALYKSTPGYSSKAKEAFENALSFDPENAAALQSGVSVPVRDVAVNRVNNAPVNAAPPADAVAFSSPISSNSVDGALRGRSLRFEADRNRDNVVRTMLAQGIGNPPTEMPSFDTPYPARANTYTNSYSNSGNYSDGYRPRHASNCSPNRFSIFPCSVSIPGVTVTSSNPTYVVGGNYQQTPQHYCQRMPQSYNTPNTYTPNTGTYTPPTYTYSRPPQTSTPGLTPPNTTTTTTTILTPSQPSNGYTQPNRPPPATTTTTFRPQHGNNGVGNGIDPQPPGNPPPNDLTGSGPGNPGNSHRARRY
jgi:hypothetical protein